MKKTAKSKFTPGRAGIEARLYIVRGWRNTTKQTDENGDPAPMDVLRIGADNINDLMEYLKKFESDFDVHQVKLIGMMLLCSGTPY